MREGVLESVGVVLATLMARGEFDTQSPAWDALQDEEVLMALGTLLAPMHARVAMTPKRCFLIPTDVSSPFLRDVPKMRDVFKDQHKDDPGRLNLAGVVTLLVLRKLLDDKSEDGLSQAGRGGVVPVQVMVDEVEDALSSLGRLEGLSDHMVSALKAWERMSQPPTGYANVNSHEGFVRHVLSGLSRKGIISLEESGEGVMTTFRPTMRLSLQAREVLDSERYQEIVSALEEGE